MCFVAATAEALFGDADDISTDEEKGKEGKSRGGEGSDDEDERKSYDSDGKERQPMIEDVSTVGGEGI